ncbi:MAG: rhomboid family intramembrane serine protease [Desulfobacteraceae bacterium]|nr:MAG: rhomboid family intramembrane serine protease [Desulfobacteraceae bacterium]
MTQRQPHVIPGSFILKGMIFANILIYGTSLLFSGAQAIITWDPMTAFAPSYPALMAMGAAGTDAVKLPVLDIWWTWIAANWLHASLIHLLFNMVALWQIASLVTMAYGTYRMFTIYTLSGLMGFSLSYLAGIPTTVGASAGICGLIGAAWYFGRSGQSQAADLVYRQTRGWIVVLIIVGFVMPNINNWGHGGGLIGGIIAGWMTGHQLRRRSGRMDQILCMTLMLLTFLILCTSIIIGCVLMFT